MKTRAVFGSLVLTIASSVGLQADVVTEWNAAALDAIRTNRTPPPRASRALAILHVSIYDAVNGIDRRNEAYLVPSDVPAGASREAAASAAAHETLVALFPASAPAFDALHDAILAAISDGPRKSSGMAWGESVAEEILAARANDGSDSTARRPAPCAHRNRI